MGHSVSCNCHKLFADQKPHRRILSKLFSVTPSYSQFTWNSRDPCWLMMAVRFGASRLIPMKWLRNCAEYLTGPFSGRPRQPQAAEKRPTRSTPSVLARRAGDFLMTCDIMQKKEAMRSLKSDGLLDCVISRMVRVMRCLKNCSILGRRPSSLPYKTKKFLAKSSTQLWGTAS